MNEPCHTPDLIVTDEAYMPAPPPIDIPEATEPLHIGRTFHAPAPVRTPEQEHPWLWAVYIAAAAAMVLLSVSHPMGLTW